MSHAHPTAETWRKVGVKPGHRLVLLHAPASWNRGELPADVALARRRGALPADVVVAFYGSLAALRRDAAGLAASVAPVGAVWVAWPRRAGGHESDLGDGVVRETLLGDVLVDVKVAALDADWSALKFVWRTSARPR